jgi:type III secretion protein J
MVLLLEGRNMLKRYSVNSNPEEETAHERNDVSKHGWSINLVRYFTNSANSIDLFFKSKAHFVSTISISLIKQANKPAIKQKWATPLIMLGLVACSPTPPLYDGLSQRDANEMRAILDRSGISAQRVQTKEGTFSLEVPKGDTTKAVETLAARGYPKRDHANLGTVFGEDGLIRTPLQERAKLVHALNEELEETISSIDGVTDARVMVVVPDTDPLKAQAPVSSASVMVEHGPSLNAALLGPQIRRMIASSVEGLTYERVTVTMFPSSSLTGSNAATTQSDITSPSTNSVPTKTPPSEAKK